jgi:peptidyl-prolyl cis-trans isomerase A (cyclophilin A)
VVEGQDVVDAIAQGDLLESVEIVRVGKKLKMECYRSIYHFWERVTNVALKADAEAAMEKLVPV